MCRSIKTLRPPFQEIVTEDDMHAAALQYVRKISGFRAPAAHNAEAFDRAVAEIAHVTRHLLDDLVTAAPPKNREEEAAKARERSARRYATQATAQIA